MKLTRPLARPTAREPHHPYLPVLLRKDGSYNAGKHSSYREEFAHWGFQLTLLGATLNELGNAFGVDPDTVNEWKKRYPDFAQAIFDGREIADARVAAALYKKATGFMRKTAKVIRNPDGSQSLEACEEEVPGDLGAMIYWLKMRRPDTWGDKPLKKVEINAELLVLDPYSAFRALKDAA